MQLESNLALDSHGYYHEVVALNSTYTRMPGAERIRRNRPPIGATMIQGTNVSIGSATLNINVNEAEAARAIERGAYYVMPTTT